MVLTQCACSDNVRINFPYIVSLLQQTEDNTDIDSGPDFDGSITASGINDSLSTPSYNIDTSSVSSQDEIEFPSSSMPNSDGPVLGGSCYSRRGDFR
jgi:hypothetical protein